MESEIQYIRQLKGISSSPFLTTTKRAVQMCRADYEKYEYLIGMDDQIFLI